MRDVMVYWSREGHTFTVVRPNGAPIADGVESIEAAWAIAEKAQQEADDYRAWIHWRRRIETRRPVTAH